MTSFCLYPFRRRLRDRSSVVYNTLSTMERKQSKKVKSLRATTVSGNSVNKQSSTSLVVPLIRDRMRTFQALIPAHSVNPVRRMKRRFTFGTNFSGNVIQSDGHDQFLVASSSTVAIPYVDVWRIKKLTVYVRNNEADYSCQVQITPSGSDISSNNIAVVPTMYAVESQSSARATCMEIIPSPVSPMGCWHRANATNNAGTLFAIATSSGGGSIDHNSLMDIEFEYILNLIGSPPAYSHTGLSGLSVGVMYGGPLAAGLIPVLDNNTI